LSFSPRAFVEDAFSPIGVMAEFRIWSGHVPWHKVPKLNNAGFSRVEGPVTNGSSRELPNATPSSTTLPAFSPRKSMNPSGSYTMIANHSENWWGRQVRAFRIGVNYGFRPRRFIQARFQAIKKLASNNMPGFGRIVNGCGLQAQLWLRMILSRPATFQYERWCIPLSLQAPNPTLTKLIANWFSGRKNLGKVG